VVLHKGGVREGDEGRGRDAAPEEALQACELDVLLQL